MSRITTARRDKENHQLKCCIMSIFHSPIATEQIQVLEVKFKHCPNGYLILQHWNSSRIHTLLLRVQWYTCSTQSENLCNFEIALHTLRILRLHTILARSQDCAIHLRDLEIMQYTCVISTLCNYSAQFFTPMRMCRNHLVVTRSREDN